MDLNRFIRMTHSVTNLYRASLPFLQVQLRLQQVVSAPSDKREDLLKELEHFAFRGIPNVSSPRLPDPVAPESPAKSDQMEDKSLQVKYCQTIRLWGSGGSVVRVVASDTRDPQLKFQHQQNFIYQLYI